MSGPSYGDNYVTIFRSDGSRPFRLAMADLGRYQARKDPWFAQKYNIEPFPDDWQPSEDAYAKIIGENP